MHGLAAQKLPNARAQHRPPIRTEIADSLNRIIESTPNTLLEVAVPVGGRNASIKAGQNSVSGVSVLGTTADYSRITTTDIVFPCGDLNWIRACCWRFAGLRVPDTPLILMYASGSGRLNTMSIEVSPHVSFEPIDDIAHKSLI